MKDFSDLDIELRLRRLEITICVISVAALLAFAYLGATP